MQSTLFNNFAKLTKYQNTNLSCTTEDYNLKIHYLTSIFYTLFIDSFLNDDFYN